MREFETIAEAFMWIREKHGLSQKDMAFLIGVSRVTVLNIERGRIRCHVLTLLPLMELFEFSLKVDVETMVSRLRQLEHKKHTKGTARTLGLSEKMGFT